MKLWPSVHGPDIVYYLLHTKACDLKDVKAFKSLDSFSYLQSGLVGTILVHKIDDNLCYLKCEVGRSQSANAPPHKAWVCVHQNGNVVTGGCSCMAGQAKVCSHVGALLWKVEYAVSRGLTGATCTDEAAVWNRGTKRNVVAAGLDDITFGKNDKEAKSQGPAEVLEFSSHEDYVRHLQKSPLAGLISTEGTLLYETLAAAPLENVGESISHLNIHTGHEDATNLPDSCPACYRVYCELICLPESARKELCNKTAAQGNAIWRFSRRIRLTSSMLRLVPKKETTDPQKAVKAILHPTFTGNKATEHGRISEPVARRAFEEQTGVTVAQVGLVVSPDMPWIAASPDGIIEELNAILEIKCPLMENCTELVEGGKFDVRRDSGGHLVLAPNGKNAYYYQVQFAMLCTGMSRCFFFLWSKEKTYIIDVPHDVDFVTQHLPRMRKFYFGSLLPAVVSDLHTGRLQIAQEYTSIAEA